MLSGLRTCQPNKFSLKFVVVQNDFYHKINISEYFFVLKYTQKKPLKVLKFKNGTVAREKEVERVITSSMCDWA
jgi:hypothetical protein